MCTKHQSPSLSGLLPNAESANNPAPSQQCRPRAVTMRSCHRSCHRPVTSQPRSSRSVTWLVPFTVPRQLYLKMPTHWCKHLKWACSEVPRLAVLPGSSHSNPLFHFSGLSFWHSEKHHLKLIKAPYFVPNLTTTNSVYYVLCRVGGSSQQGVLGCATKTHRWGDICRVNRMWIAFPQITGFAQITGLLWWNPRLTLQGKASFLATAS